MEETILRPGKIGGIEITNPVQELVTFNMLIYGDSGVGKTRLVATAAEVEAMSPVLLIDVEGGTLSLMDYTHDIDIIRVTSYQQFIRLHAEIKRSPYKTVIIDSLSEVQKLCMEEIMKNAQKDDPEFDIDKPRIQDWGKNLSQTRRLVRAYRDLPVNVIMTALAQTDQSRPNKPKAKPAFTGKAADEVPGFLDIVLYMYTKLVDEKVERRILSMGTPDIIAKDRTSRLPQVMQDPTFGKIYQTIHGNIGEQDD